MKIKINKKGFSLVEILVVVGILSASILAIYALVARNINVQKRNKDYLMASMLAQEGLELVREVRDENKRDQDTNGDPWTDLINALTGKYYFRVDYLMTDPPSRTETDIDATNEAECRLWLDGDFYSHDDTVGAPTIFYRYIEADAHLDPAADASNLHVEFTAHVQWIENGARKEYAASTLLYDWR